MLRKGLSGNFLKLIALITMTVDHIGHILLPQYLILRVIGRLAFPIYAYMIAEGCHHTKNKAAYLGTVAGVGLACQLVYFITMRSMFLCILITFSLSIAMIYLLENAEKRDGFLPWLLVAAGLLVLLFLCVFLPWLLPGTDYGIDYGLVGILLPVLVYVGRDREERLFLMAVGLVLLAINYGGIQWYALAALPLLTLYNGKRGSWKLKWLFYVYYPLHLAALQMIALLR